MFKVTAGDQGHYKGHSGAFVTYCNISCFILKMVCCMYSFESREHPTDLRIIENRDDIPIMPPDLAL